MSETAAAYEEPLSRAQARDAEQAVLKDAVLLHYQERTIQLREALNAAEARNVELAQRLADLDGQNVSGDLDEGPWDGGEST